MFKQVMNLFKKEIPEKTKEDHPKLPKEIDSIIDYFKTTFHAEINQDIIFRELYIPFLNKRAVILFIETICDTPKIENSIVRPLVTNEAKATNVQEIIFAQDVEQITDIKEITNKITSGSTAIFIDGSNIAHLVSSEQFEGGAIEKAETEVTLKGPKDSFADQLHLNVNLIRKKVRNNDLVNESILVGERSLDSVCVLYLADLVNENILETVKDRITQIDTGSVQNVSVLLQYIQDAKYSIFPTILETERPDRAATYIEDGHIVLAMENSDTVLVVPVSFWSFLHLPDDRYLHFIYGNFIRVLRAIAIFITLFTSATYVGVTNFHTEMIPADLLLAIAATREKVPFPAVVEVLLMELAFELIREAGLRVPNPIGPTIGIVGALILGQAASEANIVSPIVIIVVALSGLSSFIVNNISMNFAFRICRFFLILAAGLFGFYGIVGLFMLGMFYLASLRSFGVPYFAPLTPYYKGSKGTILQQQVEHDTYRTPFVKPKDLQKKKGETND